MDEIKMNLSKFREYAIEHQFYCFGSGLQGQRVVCLFETWNCISNIVCFIDNDINKRNTTFLVNGYEFSIFSLNDVIDDIIKSKATILISCADVINVVEQLDTYEQLTDNKYCSLTSIAQQQLIVSDYNDVVHETSKPIIPKVIHYCWFGSEMPDTLKKNVERWHILCPDYEIKKWDETNYDITKCDYMREAYESKQWAFVPDYIRLDLLYQYGGLYFDTDVEMLKCPDDWLYQRAFGIVDCSSFLALGAGCGAAPRQEIIRELRDYYHDKHFTLADGLQDRRSCQLHQYNVTKRYGMKYDDSLQNVGGLYVYPMIAQGTITYTYQMRISEGTYWMHMGSGKWVGKAYDVSRMRNRELKVEGLISYN